MALQQALPTSPPTSSENGRKNMLREMLKLILEGNTFKFAGRTYKQIKGIAMGTPVAPTWANLFMGKLETDALTAWPGPLPLIWLRYIDDILTLFPGTQTEFDTLLVHLNSRMKSIKFTSETSKCKIDFLDVTIFKGERFQTEGVLDIRPYSKAIDPHTYLPWYLGSQPVGKNTLDLKLRKMCSLAGIQGGPISNHSLRATSATRMFEMGVPEKLIKERTGHNSLEALRTYERNNDKQHKVVSDILSIGTPNPSAPFSFSNPFFSNNHTSNTLNYPQQSGFSFNNLHGCTINIHATPVQRSTDYYLSEKEFQEFTSE